MYGKCIWFTGLSGSGKSTLAGALSHHLNRSIVLDGDEIRRGINYDLTFSQEDRSKNIRRVAFLASCIVKVGGCPIIAAISPYAEDRKLARELIGPKHFNLIYLSTSIEDCEKRDVKGLYAKARNGEIKNFTGISDPYEPPGEDEECLTIDTAVMDHRECLEEILEVLFPIRKHIDGAGI